MDGYKIPPPPSGAATVKADYAETFFDDTVEYEEPPYLFEYRGVGFSPLGGIQALSGQKKNGKSICVSILMATVLSCDNSDGRFAQRFPGLRLRQSTVSIIGHQPRILYVDTEQEKENTDKVVERAKWLSELQSHVHDDRLNIQWLRVTPEGEDPADYRKKAIFYAIDRFSPDLVFIDGIRDLVHDFNDIEESANLINSLMALSSKRKMCIWNTLHMNPRPQNDDQDGKMRGHLGTELGNKVSDVFVMRKAKNKATQQVSFTMHQLDARGKDVDDLVLTLNDDAGPVLGAPIAKEVADGNSGADIIAPPTNDDDVVKLFKSLAWKREGVSREEINGMLADHNICGAAAQSKVLKQGTELGIILHQNRKPYYLNSELAKQWDNPLGDGAKTDKEPF